MERTGAALKTAVAFTSQSTNAHCSETRKFVKDLNNSYKHGKYLEVEKQLLKRSGLLLHPEFQSRLGSHVECINGIKHPKCSQVYCFQVDKMGDHLQIETSSKNVAVIIPQNTTICESVWQQIEVEICGSEQELIYLPTSVQIRPEHSANQTTRTQ
ncbi:uncharacterized protein LOC142353974 isoform X2 [Convolutriloba macropyga]|uniref:uncharacterized protein LOC142353974 isoform X2 n=1 Tax=Convolutriloba macropyga TaxID=536237 RepID=UPI003F527763